MAFMMPVMKNEFDIYKTSRARNASECSNNSSACRSRKISETRSECPSLSTSPSNMEYQRNYMNRNNHSAKGFSRTSSRTSQSSLTSPTRNNSCSPPKPSVGSQGSLNKFHIRLVDKLRKSFSKGRSEDRSWKQSSDEDENEKNNNSDDDDSEKLSSENSEVEKSTLAKTHQIDTTTIAITKPLKKLSISSGSTHSSTPNSTGDVDNNSSGIGLSDSILHISSKPPLPPANTSHRSRSRSIETSTFKSSYRHSSVITCNRLWSVHGYAEASKIKR